LPASKYLSSQISITSPPILDEETAVRLRIAIARLSRRLRPTAAGAAAGLTPTRISVLLTIVRQEEIRVGELASVESLNPTMLSRITAELAAAGLISREVDPRDRRAATVTASRAGVRLRERIHRERTQALAEHLELLDEHQRELLWQALPVLEELAERLAGARS